MHTRWHEQPTGYSVEELQLPLDTEILQGIIEEAQGEVKELHASLSI
jgi:hypothetical protein